MMNIKKILKIGGISTIIVLATGTFALHKYLTPNSSPAQNELAIPKLIDSKEVDNDIELTLQNTQHEFYEGIKSNTKGFSQSYLGPTIRLYKNQDTRIRFTNEIGEKTTVHSHGLHIPGKVDGGPQNAINPGDTWDIALPIRQQASTNWYHPHLMHKTAEHVYSGLAGLYIIEDDNSLSLPIPKDYGVDDIPLIIQDRSFKDGKMDQYPIMHEANIDQFDMEDGQRGNTLVTNGTVDPYIEVPKGWMRLRLLNASNARFYDFHLKNNEAFYKIATEGGFLEEPVKITSMKMLPGERNEIMVDMSDGETRELLATFFPAEDDDFGAFLMPTRRVLEIRANQNIEGTGELPKKLNTITPLTREDAVKTRKIELQMEPEDGEQGEDTIDIHNLFRINGNSMDMSRIDERVKKGDIEIWEITRDEMDHPFHVHGTSFQILSKNGRAPAPEDRGWKDTVEISWGTTELIMKFDYEATDEYPYMYHCHILEHEDGGMMGQFTVK